MEKTVEKLRCKVRRKFGQNSIVDSEFEKLTKRSKDRWLPYASRPMQSRSSPPGFEKNKRSAMLNSFQHLITKPPHFNLLNRTNQPHIFPKNLDSIPAPPVKKAFFFIVFSLSKKLWEGGCGHKKSPEYPGLLFILWVFGKVLPNT